MSGEVQASPEEQAVYERFVARAVLAIYDDAAMPQVLEMLKSGDTPKDGVARAAAVITMRVKDAAEKAGQDVSEVLMPAGAEIVETLVELSEAAGIGEFSPEDLEGAFYLAVDHFRTMLEGNGQLDKDKAVQDFQAIAQAGQEGQLDDLMGRMASAQGGGQGEPQGAPQGEKE